ncbi:MAG: methylated-DNA--[protein]-cysteine S-methyltransferase, partial [Solirubrobacteraceae bacterium]
MTPLPDALLESVAAAAVREGLADAVFTRLKSPIGRLLVVQGERGVVRVGFEDEPEDRVLAEVAARFGPRLVGSDRELAPIRDALEAYFAGEGDPHDLPVDLSLVAAPFRHAVLETLHDEVA